MKKKCVSFILAFIMVFISVLLGVTPAHAAISGDFNYTDNGDGTCTLNSYTGAAVNLEIPATLGGLTVTSIGTQAIYYRSNLTSLTIPSGVTSIGTQSISCCSKLTAITLPSSLTSIGDRAFSYCSSLTDITIPSGVTSIGIYPFYECRKLTSISVDEGNQNYASDNGILYNKDKSVLVCCPPGLTSVTIPDGVTSIAVGAFNCCELTGVTIPDSVTSIGDYAFAGTKLSCVTIPNNVTAIGDYTFYDCSNLASVTIPDSVTSIGDYAFVRCGHLESVLIPDSVTSIGDYAFAQTALTGVTIPNSVTSIGKGAFASCDAITSITIPSGITSIEEDVFAGSGLTSITIPNNITSIGLGAFSSCANLSSVTILDGVTSIGARAFDSCSSLSSIIIPDSVTSIGYETFYSCESLSSITIPDSVTSIGENAFDTCSSLTSITIPHSVTDIGSNAFNYCTSMTDIIVDPGNQNYSSSNGLLYNKTKSDLIYCPCGLASVTIPNSVTSIKDDAFAFCAGLTSVTIPDSVTSIGDFAFYCCTSLNTVYLDGSMPAMGIYVFDNCPFTLTFYCPDGNPGGITLTPLTQVPTKTITVSAVNGTITPSTSSGMTGEIISFDVAPATGYILQAGSLKYNDGSDHLLSGSSFTMPNSNITISALFDEMTISVDSQNGDITVGTAGSATFAVTTANIADGTAVTVNWCNAGGSPAATPIGLSAAGTNIASNSSTVTVTANTAALPGTYYFKATSDGAASDVVTVTVQPLFIPSGNGGGSGNSTTDRQKIETTLSGNTVTAVITTKATADSSGKATASVTQAQVSDMISKAAEEAEKQGNGTAAVAEIKIDAAADAKLVEAVLPKIAVDAAAKSNLDALTVSTPVASITFDKEALDTIAGAAAANVTISMAKVETAALSEETKQIVGDRPLYNFSVTSGDETISQFDGNVTVSVPYTPRTGEDTSAIVIYYINAEGKAEIVSNCTYDPETGTVIFTTRHFSVYAVGYNKISFNDVSENSWYGSAVSFIAARGITTGTEKGNFSPDAKLTRGEFIVMMMRAYEIKSDDSLKGNFADAGSTYYTGYLAAAKRMGISDGLGNNMFAPQKEITRQEMFTLLYNALKIIGRLPQGNSGKTLSDFTDAGQIDSWAKDAITLLVETGTVGGSNGALMPLSTTTRADMAQVLYNLLSK